VPVSAIAGIALLGAGVLVLVAVAALADSIGGEALGGLNINMPQRRKRTEDPP
jgi:hypothetical protein